MPASAYLDWNATAPLDDAVFDAMLPWLGERCGNASSPHGHGRRAREAVEQARHQVAKTAGAAPSEVVFTSGGSEANNFFIKGAAARLPAGRIAVGATEHPSVSEPARQMRDMGWKLDEIAVDAQGRIAPDSWGMALAMRPALISVMLANNETGVVQNIAALADTALAAGAFFHTDAVQAFGKIELDFHALGVHAMTLSAHKIGGPMGVGALVIDKRMEFAPLIAGGGQERGLRSGTENVAAIVGFGMACERAAMRRFLEESRLTGLRDDLRRRLAALGATVFGTEAECLPNTVFFAFEGIAGDTLAARLDHAGFACSGGSACSNAHPGPSRVLLAMGVAAELAQGAVRISMGRDTRSEEIEAFTGALARIVDELGNLAAVAGC
jgi:cysteine desulfurase